MGSNVSGVFFNICRLRWFSLGKLYLVEGHKLSHCSFRGVVVLAFTFRPTIHFELIFYMMKIRVKFNLFNCEYVIALAASIDKNFLSLGTFVIKH